MQPLLSIVIPTYNRAHLLRLSLNWLQQQVAAFGELLEVVVSDNHSTDDTGAVLASRKDWHSLRVVRPPTHMPAHEHYLWLATEVPKGKYCWMLGDDDFPLCTGVARILLSLTSSSPPDYILINVAVLSMNDWLQYISETTSFTCSDLSSARISPSYEDKTTDSLKDIIECGDGDAFIFCGIPAHIFRPLVWRDCINELDLVRTSTNGRFTNLHNTFPHLAILFHCDGRCRFEFIHDACVVQTQGAQEWSAQMLSLLTNSYPYIIKEYYALQLSDTYLQHVASCFRRHQWQTLLRPTTTKDCNTVELLQLFLILLRPHTGIRGKVRALCCGIPIIASKAYTRTPNSFKRLWRAIKAAFVL